MESFDELGWVSEIEQMTVVMRRSRFPVWIELREQLRALEADPDDALLVESYADADAEIGVVIARPALVLVYRRTRDGTWSWHDISDDWEASEFSDQVRVGLRLA